MIYDVKSVKRQVAHFQNGFLVNSVSVKDFYGVNWRLIFNHAPTPALSLNFSFNRYWTEIPGRAESCPVNYKKQLLLPTHTIGFFTHTIGFLYMKYFAIHYTVTNNSVCFIVFFYFFIQLQSMRYYE